MHRNHAGQFSRISTMMFVTYIVDVPNIICQTIRSSIYNIFVSDGIKLRIFGFPRGFLEACGLGLSVNALFSIPLLVIPAEGFRAVVGWRLRFRPWVERTDLRATAAWKWLRCRKRQRCIFRHRIASNRSVGIWVVYLSIRLWTGGSFSSNVAQYVILVWLPKGECCNYRKAKLSLSFFFTLSSRSMYICQFGTFVNLYILCWFFLPNGNLFSWRWAAAESCTKDQV